MASSRKLWGGSALTVVILLSSAFTNLLMLRAFDLAIPALAAAILLHAVSLGPQLLLAPFALIDRRDTPARA